MAKTPAVYQSYLSNILRSGVWTGTAPSSSYSLSTLGTFQPAARVRFGSGTVTVTCTITSARGDVLVIPMHNLVGAVLTLTNGAGLSQAITPPALQADGFPPTLVIDLVALEPNNATRTSTVWNLVIASNPANVILGGFIGIYGPKTTLLGNTHSDNFAWDFHERERYHTTNATNDYGTRYTVDYGTKTRAIDVLLHAKNAAGTTAIRDWFRGGHGGSRPSLFWPDPTVGDAYIGTWQDEFDVQNVPGHQPIALTFTELSKGQVIS